MFNQSNRIRFIFILVIIAIAAIFFYINSKVITQFRNELNKQVNTIINVYHEEIVSSEDNFDYLLEVLVPLIDELNIPMIIKTQLSDGSYSYLHLNIDVPYEVDSNKYNNRIEEIIRIMDQNFSPLTLIELDGYPLIQIHYGDTKLIDTIRLIPYFEILFAIILVLLIIAGYRIINTSEKNLIYAGMAKETAHQLGTPISSLMGWIDLLKVKIDKKNYSIITELEKETARLENISNKFNKIGSPSKFEKIKINLILIELINYYKNRIPKSKTIEIIFTDNADCYINGDYVLLYWSFENLIKNSIDSIKDKKGKIHIELIKKDDIFIINIIDNGIGIKSNVKNKIFNPGYSTKNKGWGLGLSLSKRIINDFHKGNIKLLKSNNVTTHFQITFKNFYS